MCAQAVAVVGPGVVTVKMYDSQHSRREENMYDYLAVALDLLADSIPEFEGVPSKV
jgi:hypothetical protein